MKVPLSRLKNYIKCPDSPEQIADTLNKLGLEVEKVDSLKATFSGVVVAKLLDVIPHPHADRLRVATAFDGEQKWQIVCGASNCRTGITVPLAKIGATLPTPDGKSWKIKKTKLRDIESNGMLCAAEELGLPASEGILELPEDTPIGTDFAELIDPIFDISLTPNLGHCMSVLGIARELAAAWNIPYSAQTPNISHKAPSSLEVRIEDTASCPRYSCILVEGVTIGPSPAWLQERLKASSIRSINNAVDIGNFIMLEYGQPLHFFDYDTLSPGPIIIKEESAYKELVTLDGQRRHIPEKTLLICDQNGPLAFAGVMGGEHSSVTEKTTRILIESAYFSKECIQKSAKLLKLRTESSMRFERGIDPAAVLDNLLRAANLLTSIAGGHIQGAPMDKNNTIPPNPIAFNPNAVSAFLGICISHSEIIDIFQKLEIKVKELSDTLWHIFPPTYRQDLCIAADLMEEIARLYGYHNFPRVKPSCTLSEMQSSPMFIYAQKARSALRASGLQEFLTCNLISPSQAEGASFPIRAKESIIHVLHPRSIEQSALRPSLLPGLLQAVGYNLARETHDIQGFEVGKIHWKQDHRPEEQLAAAIILTGKSTPTHFSKKMEEVNFFELKGLIENFIDSLQCQAPRFVPSHLTQFHPKRQASIYIGDVLVGVLGELHPDYLDNYSIKQRVLFAECSLNDLHAQKKLEAAALPPPLYPSSTRDWTLCLPEELPIDRVLEAIDAIRPPLLETVFVLDLYKSSEIGKDKKNATLRFIYRDKDKTLSLEAVEEAHAQLTKQVAEHLRKKHEVMNEI